MPTPHLTTMEREAARLRGISDLEYWRQKMKAFAPKLYEAEMRKPVMEITANDYYTAITE